ncbi:MAG: Lacal_2735 family protein [Flavobacteriaceae bacterium]|nr:Lacal_2735 family protein [Flavobacteriaceae bacterium]
MELKRYRVRLRQQYKNLVEKAYSYRFNDDGLSDYFYYKASMVLEKLDRLKYSN